LLLSLTGGTLSDSPDHTATLLAGTIATGWLLEATGSYSGIFALLIIIYTAAGIAWATCISSHKLA
jgi:hypothetical protein